LTVVPAAPTHEERPTGRLGAPFLAHLIATARHMPQSRERRRGEPAEATAAYAASLRRRPVGGRVVMVA
jgi:hypothetical protein